MDDGGISDKQGVASVRSRKRGYCPGEDCMICSVWRSKDRMGVSFGMLGEW